MHFLTDGDRRKAPSVIKLNANERDYKAELFYALAMDESKTEMRRVGDMCCAGGHLGVLQWCGAKQVRLSGYSFVHWNGDEDEDVGLTAPSCYAPHTWELQGSNDGENWNTVHCGKMAPINTPLLSYLSAANGKEELRNGNYLMAFDIQHALQHWYSYLRFTLPELGC